MVLRELDRSVFTKRDFSNAVKLSVFKLVFAPILTYGHDPWVMTERVRSQVQAAEMGFSQKVHGVTLRDKVRSCGIHETLNVEFLSRTETPHLRWFGHVITIQKAPGKIGEANHAGYTQRKRDRKSNKWRDYLRSQERLARRIMLATHNEKGTVSRTNGVIISAIA